MTRTLVRSEPDTLDIAIGAAIRLRRRDQKMSQEMLAERCGVSFQQIQKYENGVNRVSFSRLVQIAHTLGVRLADLVGDIDQASGLSRNDTQVLQLMGASGALDLLKDFIRLPPAQAARIRDLVRELAAAA